MRRIVSILGVLLAAGLAPVAAQDERFEITPYYGYRFGGDIDVGDPNQTFRTLEIADSDAYGLIFDLNLGENGQLEFLWGRQQTDLEGRRRDNGQQQKIADMDVDYWQVGGNLLFGDSYSDGRGFINFMLGATHFSPEGFGSETRFSFSFGGGGKFYFGETLGVRVQGRFVSTYVNSTAEWICTPFCYTVSVGNYIVQAELAAGLIVRF